MSRLDVIFGCIVTDVIAFFIVVACAATIFPQHREIEGRLGNHEHWFRSPADSP